MDLLFDLGGLSEIDNYHQILFFFFVFTTAHFLSLQVVHQNGEIWLKKKKKTPSFQFLGLQ